MISLRIFLTITILSILLRSTSSAPPIPREYLRNNQKSGSEHAGSTVGVQGSSGGSGSGSATGLDSVVHADSTGTQINTAGTSSSVDGGSAQASGTGATLGYGHSSVDAQTQEGSVTANTVAHSSGAVNSESHAAEQQSNLSTHSGQIDSDSDDSPALTEYGRPADPIPSASTNCATNGASGNAQEPSPAGSIPSSGQTHGSATGNVVGGATGSNSNTAGQVVNVVQSNPGGSSAVSCAEGSAAGGDTANIIVSSTVNTDASAP